MAPFAVFRALLLLLHLAVVRAAETEPQLLESEAQEQPTDKVAPEAKEVQETPQVVPEEKEVQEAPQVAPEAKEVQETPQVAPEAKQVQETPQVAQEAKEVQATPQVALEAKEAQEAPQQPQQPVEEQQEQKWLAHAEAKVQNEQEHFLHYMDKYLPPGDRQYTDKWVGKDALFRKYMGKYGNYHDAISKYGGEAADYTKYVRLYAAMAGAHPTSGSNVQDLQASQVAAFNKSMRETFGRYIPGAYRNYASVSVGSSLDARTKKGAGGSQAQPMAGYASGGQQGGGYQQYMQQYAGQYMGGGSAAQSGGQQQGSNYQQYMKQYAGDYQHYMQQYAGQYVGGGDAPSGGQQQGGDYQKYMQQYAGQYVGGDGSKAAPMQQGGDYQHYMQQYAGKYMQQYAGQHTQGGAGGSSQPQAVANYAADGQQGGGYQQYMQQYAGQYMGGGGSQQGGDYQQYMKQYAGPYMGGGAGSNTGGNYQQYMQQYAGDYTKYMNGFGAHPAGDDKHADPAMLVAQPSQGGEAAQPSEGGGYQHFYQQYLDKYTQSNGKSQQEYMHQYAPDYEHFAQGNAQHSQPPCFMAKDCTSLEDLLAWKANKEKQLKFMPESFRNYPEKSLKEEFASNKARLLNLTYEAPVAERPACYAAQDCKTLDDLKAWLKSQEKHLQYIPEAYRNYPKESLRKQYESNEARILNATGASADDGKVAAPPAEKAAAHDAEVAKLDREAAALDKEVAAEQAEQQRLKKLQSQFDDDAPAEGARRHGDAPAAPPVSLRGSSARDEAALVAPEPRARPLQAAAAAEEKAPAQLGAFLGVSAASAGVAALLLLALRRQRAVQVRSEHDRDDRQNYLLLA